jgi:hypothetical protein
MKGYEVLRKKLAEESRLVADDSMAVLEEFEKFEEDLPGEKDEELSERAVV